MIFLIDQLINFSVRNRLYVLIGTLVFAAFGVRAFLITRFDALPDLTGIQVQVLTTSPGMSSEEIEMLVTVPIERAMGGLPGLQTMRSKSRAGISAISLVFADNADPWLARQMVKERLDQSLEDIPPSAGRPEVAPPSTGLGEVYQFTLSSSWRSPSDLYRIFQKDIAPRLKTLAGVVEVNAWGAGAPRLEVQLDPFTLAHHRLTLDQVQTQITQAMTRVAGGSFTEGAERTLISGVANPSSPDALSQLQILTPHGHSVRLAELGISLEGATPTVGFGSGNAEGECLFVMVQLLAGADALSTVSRIEQRVEEITQSLPDDIALNMIYNRKKLVGASLRTVARNLIEGGLLVMLVLFLLLGDFRAGLVVASVIPLSMLGAFCGLYLVGQSGNLMSLGAVDFGLIVDGTIVVTESIVALYPAQSGAFGEAVAKRARSVAGPVFFAVSILLLVYSPILLMWGVEGKLFRPMALTVLFALATALFLTFTYVPALATILIHPRGDHRSALEKGLHRIYMPLLQFFISRPIAGGLGAILLMAMSALLITRMGIEFVPRLEEGDLVVQTGRLPSISSEQGLRENTRIEQILKTFPEVVNVASRTGAPAVATDPMGLEESDILVELRPKKTWTTASTLEGLIGAISERLEAEAPGADFAYTQPIEMRFSEMLEGITSDVGIKIFGEDLTTLQTLAEEVAAILETIPGAADIVPPSPEGVPVQSIQVSEAKRAKYSLDANQILAYIQASNLGLQTGQVVRGQFRDDVVVTLQRGSLPLAQLPLVLENGHAIPLSEVTEITDTLVPNIIEREAGNRRVLVEANVRGRDLGSFMTEATQAIDQLQLPPGYWITWSGKYQQLQTATRRMGMIIPIVLFLILGVLYQAFRSWGVVALIFFNIPVAISGGLFLLWARSMPLSLSAIIGFLALLGIAVMNGIVLLSRARELNQECDSLTAARQSALERFRPVLMTAAVAGIGFLPMALAHGVGAEVQKPLATVVIGGLLTATPLTLLVLPTFYARLFRRG